MSANCYQIRWYINCKHQNNNKLHADGLKLKLKDVGEINKHCEAVDIKYTVVVQEMDNITFVFTLLSTGHCLYLSWARLIHTLSTIACQYISVILWNVSFTVEKEFKAVL